MLIVIVYMTIIMFNKYNHYWHINITITKYLVSCSQKAICFSNCGEFILRVFSQEYVSGSFFWSRLNPATNYFFEFLCVRLPGLCFRCVSGLESNFYRHHLDLRKVSNSNISYRCHDMFRHREE